MQVVLLTAQSKQNSIVKGQIKDALGMPLVYASVQLKDTHYGAVSNEQGLFTLEAPLGKYTLEVSYMGYKTQQIFIEVKKEKIETINIILKEDANSLNEVNIFAKTQVQKLKESAQAVGVIETKEVKLQSADLGEVMAKTEGISVQRAGGLGANIRFALNGLSGDKIRFFYNGIPLHFTPYAFGIANVPVNVIKQIEVYKGVVPIQFGADALGGLLIWFLLLFITIGQGRLHIKRGLLIRIEQLPMLLMLIRIRVGLHQ